MQFLNQRKSTVSADSLQDAEREVGSLARGEVPQRPHLSSVLVVAATVAVALAAVPAPIINATPSCVPGAESNACALARLYLRHALNPTLALTADTVEGLIEEIARTDRWARLVDSDELRRLERGAGPAAEGAGLVAFEEDGGLLLAPFAIDAERPLERLGQVYVPGPPDAAYDALRRALEEGVPLTVRRPGEGNSFGIELEPVTFAAPAMEPRDLAGVPALRIYELPRDAALSMASYAAARHDSGDSYAIIDLRYATGGDVFASLDAASLFLPTGTQLGAIETRDGPIEILAMSRPKVRLAADALVVLIGPHTASAAETFAALVVEHGATAVGAPSLGKCAVQSLFPLGDSSGRAVAFTTARYTPPGDNYCGDGLSPAAGPERPEALNDDAAMRASVLEAVMHSWSPTVPRSPETERASGNAAREEKSTIDALEAGLPPEPLSPAFCLTPNPASDAEAADARHYFSILLDGTGPEPEWLRDPATGGICVVPAAGESFEDFAERITDVSRSQMAPYRLERR